MPEVLKQPAPKQAATDDSALRDRVRAIIEDVRTRGDAAVREYSERFDGWSPESFRLAPEEVERIVATVPEQVLDDIRFVQEQVRGFARHQRESLHDIEVETLPGVRLGHRHVPVGAVGAYAVSYTHLTLPTNREV